MAYTSRTDAQVLMKQDQANEIIKQVTTQSKVLSAMRRLRNMTAKDKKLIVLDALPVAYFVDGDIGQKQTTKMAWDGVKITAEEIAVILPFPESVLDDSAFNIENEALPAIYEAFAAKIDAAILSGTGKPTSWPDGLLEQVEDKNMIVPLSEDYSDQELYKAILGVNGLYHTVEKQGFPVNGLIGGIGTRAVIRGLTDAIGRPMSIGGADVGGLKVNYVDNGTWPSDDDVLLAGDFTKAVYSVRQDITVKRFTEGVIQDENGDILYNLMQNDMVALRFVMRLGWALPNPVTILNSNKTTRFPFALLQRQEEQENQPGE